MNQPKLLNFLFSLLLLSVPWIYVSIIWKDLPATIPTHFGINGAPDRYGSKTELLTTLAILTGAGILVYFMLKNIHKIDPKRKYAATNSGVMAKLAMVMLVFLSALSLFIIYWSLQGKVQGINILFSGISLFMAYIGNLLHSVKPNYFAGFRLPWTLENEENWRRTHHLASKIWFIGGIVLAIASLLLGTKACFIVFFCGMMIMTIVPIIYSYNLFRQSADIKNK